MANVSSACCSLPPVVVEDYQPKGTYSSFAGRKTYVTGPLSSKKAILLIGDIFGFSTQLLQGADIISKSLSLPVYLPDFFNGVTAQHEWLDGNPVEAVGSTGNFLQAVEAEKQVESWGLLGVCWGGKIVSLYLGEQVGNVKVAAQAHPAMLDPADAEKIDVPFLTLASVDEKKEDVEAFVVNLKGGKKVEFFEQRHGWMAARGDLSDGNVREAFIKGYGMASEFFGEHL